MLNSSKLIYILADLAYIVELLPAKKNGGYAISSFRQVNGGFFENDDLNQENIGKLFTKLTNDSPYTVILPDSIFTDTILTVDNNEKQSAEQFVRDKVLANLSITDKSHQIKITELDKNKNKTRVQLTAIENSHLSIIAQAAQKNSVEVERILPLSWTVKSLIVLEPSLGMIQMGNNLYLSLHYVGVDQTIQRSIESIEDLFESIKTLKGAQPGIQSIYLLTNTSIEDKIQEKISESLPIKQLAKKKKGDDDSAMPSYVQAAIEAIVLVLKDKNNKIPVFTLENQELKIVEKQGIVNKEQKNNLIKNTNKEINKEENMTDTKLPKPSTAKNTKKAHSSKKADKKDKKVKKTATEDKKEEKNSDPKTTIVTIDDLMKRLPAQKTDDKVVGDEKVEEKSTVAAVAADKSAATDTKSEETTDAESVSESTANDKATSGEVEIEDVPVSSPSAVDTESTSLDAKSAEDKKTEEITSLDESTSKDVDKDDKAEKADSNIEDVKEAESIDLKQFAGDTDDSESEGTKKSELSEDKEKSMKKDVIKNKDGLSGFVKTILVGLVVCAITVAVGVGIGFLVVSKQGGQDVESPIVEPPADTEVAPTATPTPEPVAEIDKSELSVLVVNATTTAGYAGKFKTMLENAEYGEITAGNSKGDYEEGFYILMAEENQDLIDAVAEDTELTLEYSDQYSVEDVDGKYDFVLVLSE